MPSTGPTVKCLDERIDELERVLQKSIAELKLDLVRAAHPGIVELELKIKEQGERSEKKLNDFQNDIVDLERTVHSGIAELKLDLERALHSGIAELRVEIIEKARESDKKLTDFQVEHAHFQGTVNTTLKLVVWIGGIAALAVLSLIGFSWKFSGDFGGLKQQTIGLEERVNKLVPEKK